MSFISRTFIFLFAFTVIVFGVFSIRNIEVSENLNTTLPGKGEFERIKPFLDQGKRNFVLSLSIPKTTGSDPYELSLLADSLIEMLKNEAPEMIASLNYKSDVDPGEFVRFLTEHIYLFLQESDYQALDSLVSYQSIEQTMSMNKKQLYSPEGMFLKEVLVKDPLHILSLANKNLFPVLTGNNLSSSGGLFISGDGSKLFFLATLDYDPSDSFLNKNFAEKLIGVKQQWDRNHPAHPVDYFGTFLIADANAGQIKKDIKITATIAMVLILALLFYYYRHPLIVFLFTLPVVFSILFSIAVIYLFQGNISGLALSASAVIFGIVVDYSFHFFSGFRKSLDAIKTRNQLAFPMLVSGATTILAFLSLTLANSRVLHDFGLFTSISLLGALGFVLVVLPEILRFIQKGMRFPQDNQLDKWVGKINIGDKKPKRYLIYSIIGLTVFFLFFAGDFSFEDDLNKINYYPVELKKKEISQMNINPDVQKRIVLIVAGDDTDQAALKNYKLYNYLSADSNAVYLQKVNTLAPFIIPTIVQQNRIDRWIDFWKTHREDVEKNITEIAVKQGFKPGTFDPFLQLINNNHTPVDIYKYLSEKQPFSQLLIENGGYYNFLTSLVYKKENHESIKRSISALNYVAIVDGESVMSVLTDAVKKDFNFLVLAAGLIVLVVMLLIYGSLELTLISFLPILISWIWILGLSHLLGFKFNFVNIIIATFIFGLGDDFAIFITDGLQSRYKYGKRVIDHYKTGIILSSITTIIGTGVLFFAKHPAIKSIAGISVTGILSIVIVSFVIQPLLFRFFITGRTEKGKPPMTIFGILISVIGYTIFILGSLFGVLTGLIIRILPFSTKWKKLALHNVLSKISGFQLDILFTTTKRYYGLEKLNFEKPSVIISNHTSFFDILALARLNPKMVMLVNNWVYNSPIFGSAIRYADFIPTFEPLDENIERVRDLVNRGYSVAVFPEGSRSPDGKMRRFHKGAFFIADKLNLDITPVLLHGFAYVMPKHDYFLKSSFLSTKVLDRIAPDDTRFGIGYKERSKKITAFFKNEHQRFSYECESEDYMYYPLLFSYKYKGPILEWYFRIKWRFEKKHYENYNKLIGLGSKKIYDLGCGYGFLSYYLKLRVNEREIIGVDYDRNKIMVAGHSYLKCPGINFYTEDLLDIKIESADVILLADVLHYLDEAAQVALLERCFIGLNKSGILLIRDGVADNQQGHKWTKKSERWSTRWLKFNKTQGELHFFNSSFLVNWAAENGFDITSHQHSKNSSNMLFVLKRK